jgi:nanoRNase/pAp phosphatase (c-di-AMP/oligoRNAs hydrolase)
MDTFDQARNIIERFQNILIVPCLSSPGDGLGSALALFFTLKKLGKNVNLVEQEFPEKLRFLTELANGPDKDFVISIDTTAKDIAEMRYEKGRQDLKIRLSLNHGEIGQKDISFTSSPAAEQIRFSGLEQNADLLIVLGAGSLEDLGETFYQNTNFFYERPILNIANRPDNESFGEINLIEINSSLAEILVKLIKIMEAKNGKLMDKKTATCLLAGIIWASQNFRNPKTRPKTFETSAFLIEKGAEHQKIIQHLYKQKSLSQIKLLGRILEKISFNKEKETYTAPLTEKDFQECQASSKDLGFAMEELRFSFRFLPNLLILWESHASPPLIKGLFCSARPDLISKILENFEGVSKGEGALFLIRSSNLDETREKILRILEP